MVLKPSAVKDLSEAHQQQTATAGSPMGRLARDTDVLFLEDSQQRIELRLADGGGADSVAGLVTGVVVAVVGREPDSAKGKFLVDRIVYAHPPWPPSRLATVAMAPMDTGMPGEGPARLIAIVSGLQIDSDQSNVVAVKLLFDWLCGLLPLATMGFGVDARCVARLVVAGDSLRDNAQDRAASQVSCAAAVI